VHALQTAWWAISHTTATDAHQLAEGLELVVRAGGDTDTTAAIAGALLGARWGASAVPASWRRILHGWPGLRDHDLIRLASETIQSGPRPDKWPSVEVKDYSMWDTGHATIHPHDNGVIVGGIDAVRAGGYDAVVSLCRMGSEDLGVEHIRFWLVDAGSGANPNLDFVVDDAARMVRTLRSEGKRVLLHCVEGRSRTPSVAARYSLLLAENPHHVLEAMTWSHPDAELWRAAVGDSPRSLPPARQGRHVAHPRSLIA
jgi:ADP-ribosyl-[dinitrogen reductase] hydrolase